MRLGCDLHLHSCLSPCGDNAMTPNNIANLAKLFELDMIALTDHNTCGNSRAVMAVGESIGLTVVPAMELNTAEEAHVLCYFPDIDSAEAFSAYVYQTMPDIKNNAEVFGDQLFMNSMDEVTGSEDKLLITASAIGVYEVQGLCRQYGGVAVPAHINKSSYSVLSTLGMIDPDMRFPVCEITPTCREEMIVTAHPELKGVSFIKSSDAHMLESMMPAPVYLELEENTPRALVDYLVSFLDKGNRQ